MNPANPSPSAAPLDLDALERLALNAREASLAAVDGCKISLSVQKVVTDAQAAVLDTALALADACNASTILALVAAARRGVEDTETGGGQ